VCLGERVAAPKKKRGPILNMRENPATLGWHRVDVLATIPGGRNQSHCHSMVDRTSKILGIGELGEQTCGLWGDDADQPCIPFLAFLPIASRSAITAREIRSVED
jgi:hypothetical protein